MIFNALDTKDKEKINNNIKEDTSLLEIIGFDVTVIDLKDYFGKYDELKHVCQNYNAFCVMGGNTFVLREALRYSGFDILLKEMSNSNNYLYIGYSAGSSVLSENLDIFKIVDEPINCYNNGDIIHDGIGLINYVFIPHYKSDYHKAHLIDKIVDICERDNIAYKALSDGEIIIENTNGNI
ncbi:MAG: peptidase E [Clostridia bacterium]|nr:peptidase E [Clostridia bacterium]